MQRNVAVVVDHGEAELGREDRLKESGARRATATGPVAMVVHHATTTDDVARAAGLDRVSVHRGHRAERRSTGGYHT